MQLFIFVLGVVVGSFLNVVILRRERARAVTGRSACMSCGKQLRWFELIPIFSFLIQKGRCRGCGTKLSLQYPLVELVTGVLFFFTYAHILASTVSDTTVYTYLVGLLHLIIWSFFIVITVYDFHTKLIPNEFSYSLAVTALVALFVQDSGFMVPSLMQVLAGPILFLPFYLLWKVSDGRWLGLGDGKLAFGIGLFLGLPLGGTAILFAFWIGAGFSLLLIVFQKGRSYFEKSKTQTENQLTLRSEVPFGPFLVIGTLIVYLWNINLYTALLLP